MSASPEARVLSEAATCTVHALLLRMPVALLVKERHITSALQPNALRLQLTRVLRHKFTWVNPYNYSLAMEACLAVEREQDKVIKKLKTVSGSASEKLQRVLDQIQSLKEQLAAGATCESI